MFNPVITTIMQMMSQGGGNPQQMAQQILAQNPEFAKQIQGQDVQKMAQQMLRQRGIDPGMIQQMMGRK